MYYNDEENIESLMQPEFIEGMLNCRNPLVEQKRNQIYDFEKPREEDDYFDHYMKESEQAYMELHGFDEYFDFDDEIETEEELVKEATIIDTEGADYKVKNTKTYNRSCSVVEYTKKRANGYCELCEKPAPFHNKKGEPYLEVHHIVWLSKGGADTIDNTVALCPNCHCKMHFLDLLEDVDTLKEIVKIHTKQEAV